MLSSDKTSADQPQLLTNAGGSRALQAVLMVQSLLPPFRCQAEVSCRPELSELFK